MTENELIEEAKNRYPIGCKYWNLNMAGGRSSPEIDVEDLPEIPEDVYFIISDTKSMDGSPIIAVKSKKSSHGWVYSQEKWAEIVSYPEGYILKSTNLLKQIIIW